MANITEKEVVDLINSEDVSILDEYAPYIADKEFRKKFERDAKNTKKKLDTKRDEIDKFFKDQGVVDVVTGRHEEGNGYDRDVYYDVNLVLNDVVVDSHYGNYYSRITIKDKVKYFNKFIEDYNRKSERVDQLVNGEELQEYNSLVDELEMLEDKGFFGKLAASGKIRQVKKRLAELKKYADEYNELSGYLRDKMAPYKVACQFAEKMNKLADELDKLEKLDKEYQYSGYGYGRSDKYMAYEAAEDRIKERKKNVKNFRLIKFFREHEEEFKNTRKTLIMIYAENTDKEFQNNFKTMLAAYDQAAKIAKEEGKDFNTLKEAEQFEYFEAAQKVIEANKQFGTYKDGDGKQ